MSSSGDPTLPALCDDPAPGIDTAHMRASIASRLFDAGPSLEIGRFSVLERIGAGGMGTVYAAYDPQLDRRVALKVLRDVVGDADSEDAVALLREARAMARISHPNVVTVHEVGVHDGRVWLAMEFVAAGTLEAFCARHPPSDRARFQQVLDLFVQAARGLAAAHSAGIVHRDLKPSNILVDEDLRLRVADFGLARATAAAPDTDTASSSASGRVPLNAATRSTGLIAGTPAYMPPEQLEGRSDERSDQWSLCATFWEAAFGERPYGAPTITASLARRLDGPPSLPANRSEVPAWFHTVLQRGLSPDPAQRFASVAALLAEVERRRGRGRTVVGWAGAAGIAALAVAWVAWPEVTPPSPCTALETALDPIWSASTREQLQRVRTAAGSTERSIERVVARLDAFADDWRGGARAACEASRARGELGEGDDPLELATPAMACHRDARAHLQAVVDALLGGSSGPDIGALVRALPSLSRCARAPSGVAEDFGPGRIAAEALARGAVAAAMRDVEGAKAAAEQMTRSLEGLDRPGLRTSLHLLRARTATLTGEYEAAWAAVREALDAAEAAGDPEDLARTWLFAADAARELGRLDDAEFFLDRAASMTRRAGDLPELQAKVDGARGLVAFRSGDLDQAIALTGLELAYYEQFQEEDPLGYAKVLEDAGAISRAAGDAETAIRLFERAIAAHERELGDDHVATARSRVTLALVYGDANYLGRAEPLLIAAGRVLTDSSAVALEERLIATSTLAQLYGNAGRYEDARRSIGIALRVLDEAGEHGHLRRTMLETSASIELEAENYDVAINSLESIWAEVQADPKALMPVNRLATCVNLAIAYARIGRAGDALALVPTCETELEGLPSRIPAMHGSANRYFAEVYQRAGRHRDARERYEAAVETLADVQGATLELTDAQLGLAEILLDASERDAAKAVLERAETGREAVPAKSRARMDALRTRLGGG